MCITRQIADAWAALVDSGAVAQAIETADIADHCQRLMAELPPVEDNTINE